MVAREKLARVRWGRQRGQVGRLHRAPRWHGQALPYLRQKRCAAITKRQPGMASLWRVDCLSSARPEPEIAGGSRGEFYGESRHRHPQQYLDNERGRIKILANHARSTARRHVASTLFAGREENRVERNHQARRGNGRTVGNQTRGFCDRQRRTARDEHSNADTGQFRVVRDARFFAGQSRTHFFCCAAGQVLLRDGNSGVRFEHATTHAPHRQ